MQKSLLITAILISSFLAVNNLHAEDKEPDKEKSLSFKEYADHLDYTKNTSLHVEHYWRKTKGQQYTWIGKVVSVKGGRGKAEILVANPDRATYKQYNIVLITYDIDKAAELKLGQTIRFKGDTCNYKSRKGNPIIVYLNNVEILPEPEEKN